MGGFSMGGVKACPSLILEVLVGAGGVPEGLGGAPAERAVFIDLWKLSFAVSTILETRKKRESAPD